MGQGCQMAREAVRLGSQTCIARLAPAWRAGETLQTRTCEHACMPALEYQVDTFPACLQALIELPAWRAKGRTLTVANVCRVGAGGHSEAALGQWSYCIGPCRGIELGDQLWVSRFILLRMADQFRFRASLEPKPVPGDWPGNGAHVKVRAGVQLKSVCLFP